MSVPVTNSGVFPLAAQPELPPPTAQPELPPPAAQPQLPPPAAQPRAVPDRNAYKNLLQELAQKSSLLVPTYSSRNEGPGYLPRFRATVWVDGKSYTSPNTFLHRKEAEQDAARIAYDDLLEKLKNERLPLVHEELVFNKSILNEFATKAHLEMPTYFTRQIEGDTPSFESTLSFNNVTYPARIGKNKKEAEQLAAREAIRTLLGNAVSGAVLSPILKSKARLIMRANQSTPVVEAAADVGGTSTGKDRSALPDDTMLIFVAPQVEFAAPAGASTSRINLPIAFVPASSDHQSDGNPDGTPSSSKKRRRNRNKANKRARADGMVAGDAHPLNQAAECSAH